MAMLTGKTAVITGSTSGIGLSIARAFAEQGANIVLNGLGDHKEINDLCEGLRNEFGVKVHFNGADMTKPEEIRGLIVAAEELFGAVDILVNNAGIQYVSPVEDFPEDRWDAILAINLSSSFHTIKAALPGMRKKGWGRIINIASAHGLVASPYKSAYIAAKHGMVGLTKTIALETARDNITVNAICPGYVLTPLVEGQIVDQARAHNMSEDEVKEKVMLKKQPTKTFIAPEEVARMALYLCENAAQGVTGTSLSIDGGWIAE